MTPRLLGALAICAALLTAGPAGAQSNAQPTVAGQAAQVPAQPTCPMGMAMGAGGQGMTQHMAQMQRMMQMMQQMQGQMQAMHDQMMQMRQQMPKHR